MGDGTGILVVGELADGAPISATLEALAAARAVSDALGGEQVVVLLPGEAAADAPQTAIAYGADAVYTVQDPALVGGSPEALTAAAEAAVAHAGPRFVIGSKTITGRDVMPRLAFRLGTALAQDCTMRSRSTRTDVCWRRGPRTAATRKRRSSASGLPLWPR